MTGSILAQRFEFLQEIDKLKSIVRASPLIDQSRRENSAEHSWHLAMYALILADHSPEPIDLGRVIQMLLLHDIVEIDAGDTPIHGQKGLDHQEEMEKKAASRIFGLLPELQNTQLQSLWYEFETSATADARFAKSLDSLQPLLHNIATDGGTWAENDVSQAQVLERYGPTIAGGSEELWETAKELVSRHFDS